MDLVLQFWGGGFYLLNKILFALAVGRKPQKKRQLVIYLLGVPAWVIILLHKHDWIAASIEAGGVPSMLFGLCIVYNNSTIPNRLFDTVASVFTYSFITMDVGYSLFDY